MKGIPLTPTDFDDCCVVISRFSTPIVSKEAVCLFCVHHDVEARGIATCETASMIPSSQMVRISSREREVVAVVVSSGRMEAYVNRGRVSSRLSNSNSSVNLAEFPLS